VRTKDGRQLAARRRRAADAPHTHRRHACSFSPAGRQLAARRRRAADAPHTRRLHICSFSPAGRQLAARRRRAADAPHTRRLHICSFSPDGRQLAARRRRAADAPHTRRRHTYSFSPAGRQLAPGTRTGGSLPPGVGEPPTLRFWLSHWKSHNKRGAFAFGACYFDGGMVHIGNGFNYRKTKSGAPLGTCSFLIDTIKAIE